MAGEEKNDAETRRRLEEAGWLLAMLLPGAMTAFLAFRSGGFYLGATSLIAAEMAVVVGLRLALARRPIQGVGPMLAVAAVAMAWFAAWTLLSSGWSDSMGRALPEYTRALLYGLTMFFFGMLPFSSRRIRWMVYGVAAAMVAVCAVALVARLLPDLIFDPTLVREDRLGYPLTYWNALGIVGCVGTVLCAHLASSSEDSPVARVLGAAAVPLLVVALYYTLSRGGIWAAAGALVLYALLGRSRLMVSAAIAVIPTTAIALAEASPSGPVTEGYPIATMAAGEHVALVLVGCMLGAALLRASLLPLDRWLLSLQLPGRARRPVLIGAAVVGLALVMAAGTAADAPDLVSSKYHEFTDRVNNAPERGERRLLSARPQGRFDLWDVALDSYREDRLKGTGAGTYELQWNRDRPTGSQVENAHSLYLEVLGELGLLGLIPLIVVLALILGAFAYRARGPDRALFAALLAAGLAWAVHAGVDWDWQMPAVTLWLFALGGAAMARSLRRRRKHPYSDIRNVALRIAGVVACLALAVLPARAAISQSQLDAAIAALSRGDCRQAKEDARSALSSVDGRAAPYMVMASCDIAEGRYRRAVDVTRQALHHDPGNWALHYNLAVARAGAGMDPRPAARMAARLNPRNPIAIAALTYLRGSGPAAWRRGVRGVALIPPDSANP
jgi:tetratricopeptide (TPR) repeat protein